MSPWIHQTMATNWIGHVFTGSVACCESLICIQKFGKPNFYTWFTSAIIIYWSKIWLTLGPFRFRAARMAACLTFHHKCNKILERTVYFAKRRMVFYGSLFTVSAVYLLASASVQLEHFENAAVKFLVSPETTCYERRKAMPRGPRIGLKGTPSFWWSMYQP